MGTLKGYTWYHENTKAILERYFAEGVSMSCATQEDSSAQKEILCELINAIDGRIINDWSGDEMTKEEAIDYVTNY